MIIYHPHNHIYYNVHFPIQLHIKPEWKFEKQHSLHFYSYELKTGLSGVQKIKFPPYICFCPQTMKILDFK